MSDTRVTQKKLALEAIAKFEPVRHVGELLATLPSPPRDPREIANYGMPAKKQKFQYTEQPARNEEPTDEFLDLEITRMRDGYWFFNNGNLEYITGHHYFLLNYWKDKGKRLVFIDAQRDFYYWWDAIEKDDNLAGGNLITNRRFGKTVNGTAILYKRTATKSDQRGGMQSKTNTDVKKVFGKLINSWMRLPDWLKPVDTGETRPATILEFFPPRKKSSKGERKIYDEALFSSIDHQPSTEEAYDGEEIHTYYEDETGKTKEVNTDSRWEIVKYCLLKASDIIGKALRTTTVEDMEKKGGKWMKKTWDASKKKEINPKTGRNETLLTNLFIPADYGYYGRHPVTKEMFVDEYGYSKRELAKQYILETFEGLEGASLAKAQQKNPLTEKHIWQAKNNIGAFDNELLEIQKDWLEGEDPNNCAPKNLRRRVTFYPGEDGQVRWKDDPKGYFDIVEDFLDPQRESNKRSRHDSGLWKPDNCEKFAIGVDPFAATIVSGPGSMGVAYVFKKFDPADPENSGYAIVRYAQRTKTKASFHKNVMLLAQYFGCKANYESDVDDYYEKWIEEGFRHYIMWRPKCTIDPQRKGAKYKYGTPSKDPFALLAHYNITNDYIQFHYNKIYFIELVLQLIDYDPDNRTAFDEVVAFGMALIGGKDDTGKKTEKKKTGLQILRGARKKAYQNS